MNKFQLKKRPVVIRRELFDHYSELGLTEKDLIILIKLIYASESSNKQPSVDELKLGSNMEPREITSIIQHLIQKDLLQLQVKKDEEGKFTEYMDLDGFFEKLSTILSQEQTNQKTNQTQQDFKDLFQYIETLFARPISPYEIETLNQWIDVDQHDFALIRAALDEAYSHDKLSFKYVDRILLNWKKNNVTTTEESKKVREQFNKPTMTQTVKHIPKFDWLNGEKLDDK
ncbi:DnaD domain-containing protein [Staphylococcus haemolyticus]|uniref:DnaD domain-containing protein n=1 Tax=Staphylococcus haemolyticus TaxID=1283 RepID=UPI0015D8C2CF|nr:DnaD domain-containing protein [Staphylococcus haemolyticus]